MAASQPGTSSSAQIADNRIFLFRLQMLIIDGGLTSLRNYVDQELAAQSTTLSASLAKEKTTIKSLKGRKIITQVQYDLLYPSQGSVSTSDLDITLIICLMRNLKCFKLNTNFNWNISPAQSDNSIEADICRLKNHRNEICHISTTTGVQHNGFINKWNEIEQILLRIDTVYPIKDFQQTITDFQFCTLDPSTEKRVTDEIEKWNKFDKSVETDLEQLKTGQKEMKQTIETLAIEQAETRKRTSDNKEELKTVNVKIAKIEQQLPEADNYQQRKIELQRDLITFYRERHSQVFLSPLFEEKDTPLASFYIRPELNSLVSTPAIKDGTQARHEAKLPVKSLSEIFKTEKKKNREIYVFANAGLGKTAFSKYLANVWCQAHCPDEDLNDILSKGDIDCMQEFNFLFLVILRDAGNLCCIDELIFEKIVSELGVEEPLSIGDLCKILKNEKCLVILDGLDEWTHPDNECKRPPPRSIPHRKVREKCTMLTTTRPWKFGVLDVNSSQLGKKIELTELNYESAVTLTERILKRLKSHPNNHALQLDVYEFISGIKSRENDELISVPLLLIYAICLWCDGVQIGNSKFDLYINIVEFLLSRTIQKHGELQISQETPVSDISECLAKYENCKKYFKLLMLLGKLSYYTLFNETRENTLVFDGSVAEKHLTPDEMKFTLHSGMLSESTSKTLTKKFSKVSFSHKTVQEFFAAIFISSENDAMKTVLEKCRNIYDILDMSIICEFISAMNADRMCAISNDLMSVINDDEKTRKYRTRTDNWASLSNVQDMFMSYFEELDDQDDCKGFYLDLSQHSTLSELHLSTLPGRLQLNITTPSLVNVTLSEINLDESSLLLSRDMLNIERVQLKKIEMSAGSLQNFITVLKNLPQSVTVVMAYTKPDTEYERVREYIRSSKTFHVIEDSNNYGRLIEFKTMKPRIE
ncbi:uncharacterized protein LOC132750616 [Ruditapes philippinarum]|uniref:uncharacterized protein LOC132750616 n=1 Tax=Ruditapes philippinarum TaxID=129788 RepID=UPI00295A6F05|nr:uncharacterized protein LOC132750616 [Ruditapes philippinarum]